MMMTRSVNRRSGNWGQQHTLPGAPQRWSCGAPSARVVPTAAAARRQSGTAASDEAAQARDARAAPGLPEAERTDAASPPPTPKARRRAASKGEAPGGGVDEEGRVGGKSARRGGAKPRTAQAAAAALPPSASPFPFGRPTTMDLRAFELVWLEHARELQLNRQAATAVVREVRQGRLPCDATLLRSRAQELLRTDTAYPWLRLRQLLANQPATLAHEPSLLLARAERFALMLPEYDTTQVLLTAMPHLDRDPDLTALNFQELDGLFLSALGARVPPAVFSYLLRALDASVLQLDFARLQARLESLAARFSTETAYVAVKRHPDLLDRDPAVLQRQMQALSEGVGAWAMDARALSRVLEDHPATLDLSPTAVQRAMETIGDVLGWTGEQVSQLVAFNPGTLLRAVGDVRERWARVRLYSIKRPRTWKAELYFLRRANSPAAAAAGASSSAALIPEREAEPEPERPRSGSPLSALDALSPGMAAAAAALTAPAAGYAAASGAAQPTAPSAYAAAGSSTAGAAGQAWRAAADTKMPPGGGAGASASWTGSGTGFGSGAEVDAEVLWLAARILTVDPEVFDRLEYVTLTGERPTASLRELLAEPRLKFLRRCPGYSRWWSEGRARRRGELSVDQEDDIVMGGNGDEDEDDERLLDGP